MSKSIKLEKSIFIAWTRISRRSEQIAKKFNMEYYRLDRSDGRVIGKIIRLTSNFFKTLYKLIYKKPHIIFTYQVHPIIALTATLYKLFFNSKVIPDLHTGAYTEYNVFPLNILNYFIWRNAEVVLVHNKQSYNYLFDKNKSLRNKLFILEDPLPKFDNLRESRMTNSEDLQIKGALISRFRPDEPIDVFIKAAMKIPAVHFFITGNYQNINFPIEKYKRKNITFTGFISDREYIALINSVDFIIVLTTWERTLLSGAYEALSLRKPLIVTSTDTLRDYFRDSVLYTMNTINGIEHSILKLLKDLDGYQQRVIQMREKKVIAWELKQNQLFNRLSDIG